MKKDVKVYEGMVKDYDLGQCVTLKAHIRDKKDYYAQIWGIVMCVILGTWGLIAVSVWVLDFFGIIQYIEDPLRDLLAPYMVILFTMLYYCGLTNGYDKLTRAINKRIDVIGGLDDGQKGEE